MMLSSFELLPYEEYEQRDKAEALEVVEAATTLIMDFAANLGAALAILEKNRIGHRLNDSLTGYDCTEVLAGLQSLKKYIAGQ